MSTKDEPAFPALLPDPVKHATEYRTGFTKYEHAALTLMAGMCANPDAYSAEAKYAEAAFDMADAYFAELERRRGEEKK